MDNGHEFIPDFMNHYYPMSKKILQDPKPFPGYFYTSFFALLLVPIGKLTPFSAMIIWGAIQLIFLAVFCIISVHGLCKLPLAGNLLFIVLCATSFPILHNIKRGQISILITTCIMAAFLSAAKNKHILAGILIALATAIKFYPAIFIIYFILKRDYRTCIAAALATFIFYLIIPSALLGFSNWLEFEKAVIVEIGNINLTFDVNSQYISHVGLRLFEIIFRKQADGFFEKALHYIGYMFALSSIGSAWLLTRKPQSEKHMLPLIAIFTALPFVLETSWPHYFVYLPLCQVSLCCFYLSNFHTSSLPRKALVAIPALSMLLSSIFVFNLFQSWSVYNSYGILFFANLLLLISIYTIALSVRSEKGPCSR